MNRWTVRLAAALLVLLAAGASAQQTKINYGPAKWASPVKPAAMYAEYCAVCHGADMKGNGPAAATLGKRPPDLTRLGSSEFPYYKVMETIRGDEVEGTTNHSREMPLWKYQLRKVYGNDVVATLGMHNLVAYIKTRQVK